MVDLSVKIGDITLQNPVMPASGAFSWEYNDVIDINRLGALVAKTICREPRLGNPTPRMAETEAGIIQSIGLPGKGINYFLDHIVPEYARFTPPLIVSVSSETVEDFAALAEELSVADVDVIEANISCPTRNATGGNFAMHEGYTRECITAMRARTNKPLWVKLSPNAGDIVSVAQAAEDAGADCLVIANTFLSLKIRTDNFRPALGNKFGGLVSPALKPIVLRMVYQVAKAVRVPIIGIGGVTRAEDVVEYMLAGATAIGIGYAGFRNPTALTTVIDDLETWCDGRGIKKVTELIGAVRDDDMESNTLAAASHSVTPGASTRLIE
jgi:dihydroorotate dehydrogenase (NAD+) catalytic subunit